MRFETGAGGKDELKLDFVTAAQGERLRETVRAQHVRIQELEAALERLRRDAGKFARGMEGAAGE